MNNKTIVINGKEIDLAGFVDDSPAYKVKEKLLENVVFELAHEPHFKAFSNKHAIIEAFRNELPLINYYHGSDLMMDHIRFSDAKKNIFFVPHVGKIVAECHDYRSFDEFRSRVDPIFARLNNLFALPQIFKASLRYINRIALRADEVEDIFEYFTLEMFFKGKQIGLLSTEFLHSAPCGALVKSRFGPAFNNGKIELIWDNEIFIHQVMTFEQGLLLLPYFHSTATKLFLEFLSDKGKERFISTEKKYE